MKLVEYEQPTSQPVPKMVAVGQANIISTLVPSIVAILSYLGVIVPDDLQSKAVAATAACVALYSFGQGVYTFVSGYYKKDEQPAAIAQVLKDSAK